MAVWHFSLEQAVIPPPSFLCCGVSAVVREYESETRTSLLWWWWLPSKPHLLLLKIQSGFLRKKKRGYILFFPIMSGDFQTRRVLTHWQNSLQLKLNSSVCSGQTLDLTLLSKCPCYSTEAHLRSAGVMMVLVRLCGGTCDTTWTIDWKREKKEEIITLDVIDTFLNLNIYIIINVRFRPELNRLTQPLVDQQSCGQLLFLGVLELGSCHEVQLSHPLNIMFLFILFYFLKFFHFSLFLSSIVYGDISLKHAVWPSPQGYCYSVFCHLHKA